jgi:photosystem II stability/assembly factor-like uncharacterized protein
MRLVFGIAYLFIFGLSEIYCQPWMYGLTRKKTSKEISFYDIQQAFNEYWKDRNPEKGKGYKPYKRWEYFMEPRVYPSGKLPAVSFWHEILQKQNNLALSPAAGVSWTLVGPSDIPVNIISKKNGGAGRINCIAFHPTDSLTLWIGAPSGGLWKTTDGGESWTTVTDQLAAIGISDIAVNQLNPNILYIATGDGDAFDTYSIGILKSMDGGLSWNATALTDAVSDAKAFRRIIIHPTSPGIMIAASSDGIYKTTNGWSSYSKVQEGHFKDLEFKPGNPAVVYATSYDNEGNATVFKSSNTGESFQKSMLGMSIDGKADRIELAVSVANPSVVYALCSSAADGGFLALYKSTSSGNLWTEVYGKDRLNLLGWSTDGSDIGGQGWYDLSLAVSPTNINVIYAGGVNIWRSVNGGSGWSLNTNWYHDENNEYVHADHHTLVYSPHGAILFSGNDGGIYKTYNDGKKWHDLSKTLEILQTYRLGLSATDPDLIITGNQDNGSILRDSAGWFEVLGGDGTECIIDYTDDNIIYALLQRGDIYKSIDKGLSFSAIKPKNSPAGAWITPFIMHPDIPGILYAGYDNLYKTLNGGQTWSEIAINPPLDAKIRSLVIAPGNDNYLYAATLNTLIKTTDGGESWQTITAGLPSLGITAIAVSSSDPNKIWVSFSVYTANSKIYYSPDGGTNWINYSTGLPNVPVNCIVYQKDSYGGIYAGTDIGVYYRNEQLSQWVDYSGNLPNVIINELEIDYAVSALKAATYGRGIWETTLYAMSQNILRADFSVSNNKACRNTPVVFEDHSSGSVASYQWNFGPGAVPSTATTKGPHSVYFTSNGKKSVSLTVLKNASNDVENKTSFIEIVDTIDFMVSPDTVSICGNTPVTVYASENYEYTWSPAEGLDKTTGNKVIALPGISTTYNIAATHGSCTASKSLTIFVTPNDNICDALPLVEGLNGPFSNTCATKEEEEPVPPPGSSGDGCQTQDGWCKGEDRIDNSLWFTFEAPDNGVVSIESEGFDNQIAVYSSPSCEDIRIHNYTLLKANDDYPYKADYSATIQELTGLTPGKIYWVQVDGSYGGVSGTFTLKLNYYRLSGINEPYTPDEIAVDVYPNPSQDGLFNIMTGKNSSSDFSLLIRNNNGETVYTETGHTSTHGTVIPINLAHLRSGLYLLEIQFENEVFHTKIIIP